METLKQILPTFGRVRTVTNYNSYEKIYRSEQSSKSAWLLTEENSIWEFIERLTDDDEKSSHETPLNLYELHIAYNLKFPVRCVSLMRNSQILHSQIKDFAELLNAVIQSDFGEFTVLVRTLELKLKILQQFIYLRIYLPVKLADQTRSQAMMTDLGLFGTKKAGKSALINALLGNEYAVSSTLLPTPNKVTYAPAVNDDENISLTYKNCRRTFTSAEGLQKFLQAEFLLANKNSSALDEMNISLVNFPKFLKGARLIDTPGSNFAAAADHADVTQRTLQKVSHAVFVMNYSQYLTQDEIDLFDKVYKQFNNAQFQRTILIVINRVDEIFDSEESKSYERVEDYIHSRLTALGYKNFLVLGISAIQAVYFDIVTRLLEQKKIGGSLDEQLSKLKRDFLNTDKLAIITFVMNMLSDFEDFHGIKIDDVRDLPRINRINYLKCLLHNLPSIDEFHRNYSVRQNPKPNSEYAAQINAPIKTESTAPKIYVNDFSADFKRVENMLADSNVSYAQIDGELNSIEWRAKNRFNANALNLVVYYREKIRGRKPLAAQISDDFSSDFKRIENMLADPNVSYAQIDGELNSIEWRAKNRFNANALNLVAYYRKKLRFWR